MDINLMEEMTDKAPATAEFWRDVDSHPAFSQDLGDCADLNPAFAGLQALKYESEDPNSNALSYKEEGNYQYQRKELKKAIDNYSAGLKCKPSDAHLNATLLTNRAIAHFYLKNYGSCVRDCKAALKFSPTHLKAYIKGAQAAFELSKSDQVLEFCTSGLDVDPGNETLSSLQMKALRLQVAKHAEEANEKSTVLKAQTQNSVVQTLLLERGVRMNERLPPLDLPGAANRSFFVDSSGKLHWSVVFFYPEFGQTDFLQDVVETSKVIECLNLVFNPNEPPPSWDVQHAYRVDDLEIYFEDSLVNQKLVQISSNTSLEKLTKRKDFCVRRDLLICLHVVSKQSEKFYNRWKAELY